MSTTKISWARRPGLTTARMVAFGLALLCALAGWLLMLFYGQVALWLLLTLLAIWLGLKGGPMLVRRLERVGFFGRVRLDRDRLSAGLGAKDLDLSKPFRVTTRLHQGIVSHEFQLRHAGVGSSRARRTEEKAFSVLQASFEQHETNWTVVADDARAPPLPSYDVAGLSCRKAPVVEPRGRVIRMHVEDLIALLHRVRDAQGYAAVTAPDTQEIQGDPRRLFWAGWKSLAGVVLLLGLGIGAAVWAMDYAPAKSSGWQPEPLTPAQREQSAREAARERGSRWLGKRVALHERDARGNHAYGLVRSIHVREVPNTPGSFDFTLSVEIQEILDVMYRTAPKDTRIRLEGLEQDLAVGSVIETTTELVYESPKEPK